MIQILIILFIAYVVFRTTKRFVKKDISIREYLIWLAFWILVGAATLVPQKTDIIAQAVGVERGADLLFFISIIALFFLVFKIIVRLEKIDKDVTEVVRNTAINKNKDE